MVRVGIIGLGKVGLCMACVYAKHGYDVVGVDVNEKVVSQIQSRVVPVGSVEEKGLVELLQTVKLEVSTDYNILKGIEIVFVIVPTPSKDDGRYDNSYIIKALEGLCGIFSEEATKPLVVIKSTVLSGSCEGEFSPLLDRLCGGMELCYSAEMIGLGNVISGLEYPDELLIGEREKESGDKLQMFYEGLFAGRVVPPIKRMSLWSAELSKLALNVFLITKIMLANTVARLCDQNPAGNVKDVLGFVGGDHRIGCDNLGTGLGVGGPCYPRDGRAFLSLAGHADCLIPKAADEINDSLVNYIYERLKPIPKVVSVLGVTYKPEIQLLDASRVLSLVFRMIQEGVKVRLHDPKGLPEAKKIFGDSIYYAESVEDCLKGAELVVVGTAWDDYKNIDLAIIKRNMKVANVYDCWGIWDAEKMRNHGIKYHAFGVGDDRWCVSD